ncbi:MAG: hypothetical protein ACE5E0_05990 [Terriglobia bacterium]
MKFTVAGSKIICSRIDNTVEEEADTYRRVVDFDAHLDTVPPHVVAKLTQGEIEELEHFLADRQRIQANPAEVNMLEALPELIGEAAEALESVNRLNKTMYQKLASAVEQLREALENVRPKSDGRLTPVEKMRDSEALKQRLENIKQEL